MTHRKLTLAVSSVVAVAAMACGGISDPNREQTLQISGALTGTELPNDGLVRVSLAWRTGAAGGAAIGADAPVVDGRYSLDIAVPPDSYFFEKANGDTPSGGGGSTGNPGGGSTTPPPPHAPPPAALAVQTAGGQVTGPLMHAVAGFLVYVDRDANGRLDPATDQVIGGDRELFLTYFRGGGSLAYEKLRDRAGNVPHVGFNLGWTEGWLSPDHGDLTLSSNARLPASVCGSSGPIVHPTEPTTEPPVKSGYPDPTDPRLHCAPDGRSFTYDPLPCPPPPPPPPPTLCNLGTTGGNPPPTPPNCSGIGGASLPPTGPVPPGWPCTVTP